MKYTITYTGLIDAILARAALCGDMTRRGHLLADNDEYALRTILETAVPALLDSFNIQHKPHPRGWRIDPAQVSRPVLIETIVRKLLLLLMVPDSTATDTDTISMYLPSGLRITPYC